MEAKEIYTVLKAAMFMGLIEIDYRELAKTAFSDSDFLKAYDNHREGFPYLWAAADLVEGHLKVTEPSDDANLVGKPDALDELPDFSGDLDVPDTRDTPEMPEHQLNAIQWADELVSEGDFVVLDTETTGLDGYPVQVAVIGSDGAVLFDELIKPPDGVTMHPKAEAVHGITLDSLKDKPEWSALFDRFCEVVKDKRVIIYNAAFDVQVMRRVATKYDKGFHPWKSAECAMEQYAEYNGDWNDYHGNYRWVALSVAANALGVVVEDAHSAKGDCVTTLGVIKALAAKARSDKPHQKEIPW